MPSRTARRQRRARRSGPARPKAGDPRSQRRKAYQRLFRRLGLSAAWQQLPRRTREALYDFCSVRSRIHLTPRARRHERSHTLADLVQQAVNDPSLGYPCGRHQVTLRDTIDLLAPVAKLAEQEHDVWDARRGAALREGLDELWPLLWEGDGLSPSVIEHLLHAVVMACAVTNSFDRPYGSVALSVETEGDATVWQFTIDVKAEQERRFVVDGKPRRAYRVADVNGLDGCQWIDLPGGPFDLGSRPVPVFVQRHALHRLWERLEIDHLRFMANLMIVRACRQARVVQREGTCCWLAVDDPQGRRMGYLIATAEQDAVLIRTFTFLTDSNAPEARKLRQLLQAAGYSYRRLRLGELSTYLLGEVPDDPQLRAIFAEANCAHLLELDETHADSDTPLADADGGAS